MKIIKDPNLERSKEIELQNLEKIDNYISSVLDQIYKENDPQKLEVLNEKYKILTGQKMQILRRIEMINYIQSL